jgi:hypothetical protein
LFGSELLAARKTVTEEQTGLSSGNPEENPEFILWRHKRKRTKELTVNEAQIQTWGTRCCRNGLPPCKLLPDQAPGHFLVNSTMVVVHVTLSHRLKRATIISRERDAPRHDSESSVEICFWVSLSRRDVSDGLNDVVNRVPVPILIRIGAAEESDEIRINEIEAQQDQSHLMRTPFADRRSFGGRRRSALLL